MPNPPIVINEVLFVEVPAPADEDRRHEWVEIHNGDTVGLDLTDWMLTDRDGPAGGSARALPAVTMPPDAYLVVHFATGTDDLDFSDGCGIYYTGDPSNSDVLDNHMDECALYADTGEIIDFLAWYNGSDGYTPGTAHDDAVARTIWEADSFLNIHRIGSHAREKFRTVHPGTSIGRDMDSTDTDGPLDWDATGGRDARDITLCSQNFDELPIVILDMGAPPPPKEWTILIYMDGDGNLEKAAYNDLKEIEDMDWSNDNGEVNIVVMVDGYNSLIQGTVDPYPDGAITKDPQTKGGTWRFVLGPEVDPRYVVLRKHGGDPFLGSPHAATPDDVNMGDPNTLAGFINWGKTTYPASKYALILWDHGGGWKGLCWDDTSTGTRPSCDRSKDPARIKPDVDAIYMEELSDALVGHHFDMLGFDECLMAMIEVAHQVQPFADYMVAAQESIANPGWPYDRWLPALMGNAAWGGQELGERIVEDFHAFYEQLDPNRPPWDPNRKLDEEHTLSCIDQRQLPALVDAVSLFGDELRLGCEDFKLHDDPTDNVEHLIAENRANTEEFRDVNFIDLHHFAKLICEDGGIPIGCGNCDTTPTGCSCYKNHLPTLIPLVRKGGPVIIREQHGPHHPDANGLSIYMPRKRTTCKAVNPDPHCGMNQPCPDGCIGIDPYDYPEFSRVTDSNSNRAMYARNNDCLPFQGKEIETGTALATPQEWPLVPAPGFLFPTDTLWDEFLLRFYHPVSDNHILKATCPDEVTIFPVVNDPECGNPIDEITIEPGCVVFFSASGSSDADTATQLPLHWMWDFDDKSNGCSPCIAPYEVPPGADAAAASNDDMNAEHDCNKAPLNDEKERDEVSTSRTYTQFGDYIVTLNVWDDNHLKEFHNTIPTASYVHPQTDDHPSIVHVVEIDYFPESLGLIEVESPLGSETLELTGPTTVVVYLGDLGYEGGDEVEGVPTEMVSMELTGKSAFYEDPVKVRVSSQVQSVGRIEENVNATPGTLDLRPFTENGTASSWFDVYFEVDIGGETLHNEYPKHMEGEITYKPPWEDEWYQSPEWIPLVDEEDDATGIAITSVRHIPDWSGFGACCCLNGECIDVASEAECDEVWEIFYPGRWCYEVECPQLIIPTVSEWGLIIMTLVLLVGAKVYFATRRTPEAA